MIGFWSDGDVNTSGGGGVDLGALYQLRFVSSNARTSTIFTGLMLVVLVPLAVVGVTSVKGWFRQAVLVAPILATIACYSAYYATNQHPRFYYVILLLPLFVLQAAGARLLWNFSRHRIFRIASLGGRLPPD